MELLRFHRNNTRGQLLLTIKGVFFLSLLAQTLKAQNEGQLCFFNQSASVGCTGVTITFNTPSGQTGPHFWNFGDGSTSTAPPPVSHLYIDVNPDLSPITATHTYNNQECPVTVGFPGIFLGTGCGSLRTVTNMITTNKLPANELVGKTLYVFGNLEVDADYIFNGCSIFVSQGGKITVKSGAKLTLKSNTIVDAYISNGECDGLWKGIEVLTGGSLVLRSANTL